MNKLVKGCFAFLLLSAGLALMLGLIAAGIGLGWELVTN